MKYKYQVGEVVNDTLKIVRRTRVGKENHKAYEVQSLMYPDAPTYISRENNLCRGQKDAYMLNQRIFEGNSLYSIEHVRPYLVDIEEAKAIAPRSNKEINLKCPACQNIKPMKVINFRNRGFNCQYCKVGNSVSESIIKAYIMYKGLKFKEQKSLPGINRIFDFVNEEDKIIIEAQGIQHFDKDNPWYKEANKQDREKRLYCKRNGWKLIEVDCSITSIDTIIRELNKINILPNIEERDKQEIRSIFNNIKNYPLKDIISMNKEGKTLKDISIETGIKLMTLSNIFKRHGYKVKRHNRPTNNKKVRCLNTGKIFKSTKEASIYAGLKSSSSIIAVCRGRRNRAGTYKGMKLKWEYVD